MKSICIMIGAIVVILSSIYIYFNYSPKEFIDQQSDLFSLGMALNTKSCDVE